MTELSIYWNRLLYLFLAVKATLFSIAFICATCVHPYNTSIVMILFPKKEPFISLVDLWVKLLLRPFASWDGAYFMTISLKGYIYEQEHAFFPLYPILVRGMADTVLRPFHQLISLPGRCILSAVAISNLCHLVSVFTLFEISCILFEDAYFAFLSAAFMVLVPMQAIMSASYSESLFTCLSLVGLLCFYQRQRLAAALAWCLAGATRSNGIFMPGFFIYEYMHMVRHISSEKALIRFIKLVILCCISWSGFGAVLMFGKMLYCNDASPRPWCSSAPFPNIYAFVQEHYWKVGFLKYYRLAQLPNFILAAPMTLFSLAGITTYMQRA